MYISFTVDPWKVFSPRNVLATGQDKYERCRKILDEVTSILEVLVTHVSLNSAGGGELVCLSFIKALRESGYSVTLATVDRTEWSRLNRVFGKVTVPNREFHLFPNLFRTSGTLNSVLIVAFFWAELLLLRLSRRDLLTINTCGEKLSFFADVAYVNGIPLSCAHSLRETSGKRMAYGVLYNLLSKIFGRFYPSLIIANSRFGKELVERCIKKTAVVVYPPVNVERFSHLANKRRRENMVLTYSQYVPTQNLLCVPMIAKLVEGTKFFVIGPGGPASASTVEKLRQMIVDLSIEDRVSLLIDKPFSEFGESLSTAKVFLRTLHHEPFGMSVVEAMAAGCVPVVPRDGGPWIDILDRGQGKYGYSYRSVQEAADVIKLLLHNEELRKKVSERAQKRALDFEDSLFKEKVQAIVKKVYASKREC